jgi:NADH:ubiquinone oxidoreductase subunit C
VIQLQKINNNKKIFSLSRIFSNATWLERENSEMFNIFFSNLLDSRKLLLDYTCNRGVLLKNNLKTFNSNYYKDYLGVNYAYY